MARLLHHFPVPPHVQDTTGEYRPFQGQVEVLDRGAEGEADWAEQFHFRVHVLLLEYDVATARHEDEGQTEETTGHQGHRGDSIQRARLILDQVPRADWLQHPLAYLQRVTHVGFVIAVPRVVVDWARRSMMHRDAHATHCRRGDARQTVLVEGLPFVRTQARAPLPR